MKKRARGFTLAELAITISILGGVVAACGAFYLEMRTGMVRSEANVVLAREASLAAETMARDLRSARAAANEPQGIDVDLGDDEKVSYTIAKNVLRRDQDPIARFVRAVRVQEETGGFRIEVELVRELAEGRSVRMVREVFVGARRK